MNIKNNVIELIGKTPLVFLSNADSYKIALKLESFNPAGSIKDRVALNIINEAEAQKLISPKISTIIEPTSGNTGIGLAMVCAIKNYNLILTMPESMSIERQKLLKQLGAQIVLTRASDGMKGAIERANELKNAIPNSYLAGQFINPANPQIHYNTTAIEIWDDTDGQIDILVAGVGTGGTITGIAKFLKEKNKNIQIVAVEPFNSAVLSGEKPSTHGIQGIGAGFIPEICDKSLIDEIIKVKEQEAIETAKTVAQTNGILMGISGGASVFAAIKTAQKLENKNKLIVAIIPDNAEKYLSTDLFN